MTGTMSTLSPEPTKVTVAALRWISKSSTDFVG